MKEYLDRPNLTREQIRKLSDAYDNLGIDGKPFNLRFDAQGNLLVNEQAPIEPIQVEDIK